MRLRNRIRVVDGLITISNHNGKKACVLLLHRDTLFHTERMKFALYTSARRRDQSIPNRLNEGDHPTK